MKSLSVLLKDGRKRMGLRQEDLAKRVGVSRVTVAQWEINTQIPTLAHAAVVCKVIEASFNEVDWVQTLKEFKNRKSRRKK